MYSISFAPDFAPRVKSVVETPDGWTKEGDFRICKSMSQNEVFCYHSVEEYFLLSTTTILLYHLSSFRSVCKNDNNNKMLHLISPPSYQEEYTTVR